MMWSKEQLSYVRGLVNNARGIYGEQSLIAREISSKFGGDYRRNLARIRNLQKVGYLKKYPKYIPEPRTARLNTNYRKWSKEELSLLDEAINDAIKNNRKRHSVVHELTKKINRSVSAIFTKITKTYGEDTRPIASTLKVNGWTEEERNIFISILSKGDPIYISAREFKSVTKSKRTIKAIKVMGSLIKQGK